MSADEPGRPDPAVVAEQLRAVLREVDAGRLDCPPAMRHHLAGAATALAVMPGSARPDPG